MEKEHVDEIRASVGQSLDRLRTLAAWLSLNEAERSAGGLSFGAASPSLVEEVREERSHFSRLIQDAIVALGADNTGKAAQAWQTQVRTELAGMMREAHNFKWPKGL